MILTNILLSLSADSQYTERDYFDYRRCRRRRDISLSDTPPENLAWDADTEKFYFLHDYIKTHPSDADLNSLQIYEGRECLCAPTRFCLDGTFCKRGMKPEDEEFDPWPWTTVSADCFYSESMFRNFAMNIWPIIWVWYLILIALLFTDFGAGVTNFILFKAIIPVMTCWLCDNNRIARRIKRTLRKNNHLERRVEDRLIELRRHSDMLRQTIIDRMQIQAAESLFPEGFQTLRASDIISGDVKVSLVLKTKLYQANEYTNENNMSDDNNSDRGQMCSICLVELSEAERIGDLPCQHTFHLSCLKMWLSRKNTCPLCQHEDVAYPKVRRRRNNAERPNCNRDQS